MSENKRFTYLNASKNHYIGSFFCNGVSLTNEEVIDLLNENEQLKQLLKSINGSFTFDDNYVSWFEDCVIVSKEGLKEISLESDLK